MWALFIKSQFVLIVFERSERAGVYRTDLSYNVSHKKHEHIQYTTLDVTVSPRVASRCYAPDSCADRRAPCFICSAVMSRRGLFFLQLKK